MAVITVFFTISVSNASCERSFSKLKLMKTIFPGSSLTVDINELARLCIERDFHVNVDSIIEILAR